MCEAAWVQGRIPADHDPVLAGGGSLAGPQFLDDALARPASGPGTRPHTPCTAQTRNSNSRIAYTSRFCINACAAQDARGTIS